MLLKKNIFKYFEKYYKFRDNSHGIEHVYNVLKNTIFIYKNLEIKNLKKIRILEAAAFLHDAYDHKYISLRNIQKIKNNIQTDLIYFKFTEDEVVSIFNIIDNISFSKELKNRKEGIYMNLGKNQLLRDIVSDADKKEAVGLIGLNRMIEYENHKSKLNNRKSNLQEHIKHIRNLCHEKLYLLISHNFIKTNIGKKMIYSDLEIMHSIVDNDNILELYLKKYL